MRRWSALITFAVLVVALAVGFVGRDLLERKQAAELAEQSAQELAEREGAGSDVIMLADHDTTVYTALGEPVSFADIADGRPLVINFWATWCPYCVDELPDFQKIVADYGDRVSFAFVDAADGQREKADDARQWLVDQGFEDLPDYYDRDMSAVVSFGVYAYPTTVIVSADGEILTISAGRIDAALLRVELNKLV
jgi:thiol-disulfide isomerase/thioredoxin